MNKFCGTGVALVTPFGSGGTVDYNALERLINFQIDNGVDYLVSLGTTGESATLTKEEKKQIWEFSASVVSKRVPLVAGIGGNSTYEVVKAVEGFDLAGYDAILSVCPYYNKPNQEGIYQHYKMVAEASALPLILYNVPGRTGVNMTAETTLRIAGDCRNVIGTKEASGNFDQFNAILKDKPADFLFISGDDPITLPLIAMGAAGVISVVGNACPGEFSTMVRLALEGKYEEARSLHYQMVSLIKLLFADGSPAGVKAALHSLDLCAEELRLPLVPVNEHVREAIRAELLKLR